MNRRSDQHDLDKLNRWHQNLTDSSADFPVYAVFLVSEADQTAHDTFRAFRKSFEARNAGFENLVIFGQHGVSRAVHVLLAAFGLPADSLPVLVLLTVPQNPPGDTRIYSLPLSIEAVQPDGVQPNESGRLPGAADVMLSRVEKLVDEIGDGIEFDGIPGLTDHQRLEEDLINLVKRLIETQR